jgi:hypothetical protein
VKLVVPVIAGVWLFAVGVQGLAFLVKYGMLPFLPPAVGRLDFTPQYTLLAALVVVGAVVARVRVTQHTFSRDATPEEVRRIERKRGKRA